jgi:hypothetical protein
MENLGDKQMIIFHWHSPMQMVLLQSYDLRLQASEHKQSMCSSVYTAFISLSERRQIQWITIISLNTGANLTLGRNNHSTSDERYGKPIDVQWFFQSDTR